MKLTEKLATAYVEAKPVSINVNEVNILHSILDNIKDIIDKIVPEARPSTLSRQESYGVKMSLVEEALRAGVTWEQGDCGDGHAPFIVRRANFRKCLLCNRPHSPEVLIEVKPDEDSDYPIVAV